MLGVSARQVNWDSCFWDSCFHWQSGVPSNFIRAARYRLTNPRKASISGERVNPALPCLRILARPLGPSGATDGFDGSSNPGPRFGIVPICRPAFHRSRRLASLLEI